MKTRPTPLVIATPCPKSWNEMSGDARRRFCSHCQLHVHNLSATPAREQKRLVADAGGQACIAYELRPDGSLITHSRWRWLLRPFQRARWAVVTALATLMPFAFSACTTTRRTLGQPAPPYEAAHTKGRAQQPSMIMGAIPLPDPARLKE